VLPRRAAGVAARALRGAALLLAYEARAGRALRAAVLAASLRRLAAGPGGRVDTGAEGAAAVRAADRRLRAALAGLSAGSLARGATGRAARVVADRAPLPGG